MDKNCGWKFGDVGVDGVVLFHRLGIDTTIMAKGVNIFVGFRLEGGIFMAATTKAGLGDLIGVSVKVIRSRLLGGMCGFLSIRSNDGKHWIIGETALKKVGGKRGIGVRNVGVEGFRGMKGKDGRLRPQADAEN